MARSGSKKNLAAVADDAARRPSAGRFPQRLLLWALAAIIAAVVVLAISGNLAGAVFQSYIYALFTLPVLAAAAMLGLLLTVPFARAGCFADAPQPAGFRLLVALALGVGAFAFLTLLLGTLHVIEPAGQAWWAWIIPVGGAVAGFAPTRTFLRKWNREFFVGTANRGDWLYLLAVVPAAMLLIAATFPPGSLWRSEGNGYDVLEYHLELPREYALNNTTAPLPHNVYSYFPQNVEMLYLLQMQCAKTAMGSDPTTSYLWGTFPAQFCHAALTLLTAAALALMPLGAAPRKPAEKPFLLSTGRAMAVLLFLGTPWTIITGSLAYNEMGMLFFGTLALGLALHGPSGRRLQTGVLVGILLGLAVGCKMTAGVFFALPIAALYLARATTDAAHLRPLGAAVLVALAVYSPWALRAAVYSGGNPVFPVATSVLPKDGWTAALSQRFDRGHAPPADQRSLGARLHALATGTLLEGQWSVQPVVLMHEADEIRPEEATLPWHARLGILWLALPLALACAFITKSGRTEAAMLAAVLGMQILAWLFLTHLQSRFLLPAAIPLALLAGRGVQGLHVATEGFVVSTARIIAGTLVGLHALAAIFLLLPEVGLFGGVRDRHSPPPIGDLSFGLANVAAAVEDPARTRVVEPAKVLLLGDAKAYLFLGPVSYSTVFDRNPVLESLNDPHALREFLRREKIHYVLVNWVELARLQDTYGLDLDVPPRAKGVDITERTAQVSARYSAGLTAALQDTHADTPPGVTIYRVPD